MLAIPYNQGGDTHLWPRDTMTRQTKGSLGIANLSLTPFAATFWNLGTAEPRFTSVEPEPIHPLLFKWAARVFPRASTLSSLSLAPSSRKNITTCTSRLAHP